MKSLSLLPFLGKIRLVFAIIGIFLSGNKARSQDKGVELKFDKYYFIHTINDRLSVKKLVQIFSSFAAIDYKGYFRKIIRGDFRIWLVFLAQFLHFLKK